MAEISPKQRLWKCPDCGKEVRLSVTQLDPLACDACLAKLKGQNASASSAAAGFTGSGLMSLVVVGVAMLLVGLVLGLGVGYAVGRYTAQPAAVPSQRPGVAESASTPDAEAPDESTRPGPGYKWVRGYTRKDGVKVRGHWAKDPGYDRKN